MSSLEVVVGGLYGSEAKGAVTQTLVEERLKAAGNVTNIRVGGPNAGHTAYYDGQPLAFRQVPVGVVCDPGPGGLLVLEIASGSEIDLPVLLDELDLCASAGLLGPHADYSGTKRVVVHGEATLIRHGHKKTEAELVGAIGSTGKGIGAARADRIMRTADRVIDDEVAMRSLAAAGVEVVVGDRGEWRTPSVVVEGVQGYALGLRSGFYPQCTSSNTRASDFMAMADVNNWEFDNFTVWVVARVFPIRVAGNSGSMLGETSWDNLGLPEEHTTVTRLIRRVGAEDWDLVRRAVDANGRSHVKVALTMLDQIRPETAGVTSLQGLSADALYYLEYVEKQVGAPISIVRTGPQSSIWV